MRLLVSGYRYFNHEPTIEKEILEILSSTPLKEKHTIIHGGCSGVDQVADKIARKHGWSVEVYPAQWKKYGKQAGPLRNLQMVKEAKPEMAILFISPESKGTKNMLTIIEEYNIAHVKVELCH